MGDVEEEQRRRAETNAVETGSKEEAGSGMFSLELEDWIELEVVVKVARRVVLRPRRSPATIQAGDSACDDHASHYSGHSDGEGRRCELK